MVTPRRPKNPGGIPAKIAPPRTTEIYRRGRLFRILDQARRRRVVFVTAPAGAGKTSLVSSYLAVRRVPALWYNVDAHDADVANLFHYMTMAARAAAGRRKIDLPSFSAENQAGALSFARGFFEALCQKRPIPSSIVLDDYQEVQSETWDQVVREALCELPRGISVLFISRGPAPAFLARHIAGQDLFLVDADDLRLTPREAAGMIRLRRPDLFKAQGRIISLANGWPAALVLLLQSRSGPTVDARGVEEFSQALFDFFATEIFEKATVAQRDFLLKTSVASALTAELAKNLTGSADGARILADLEQRGFLTQRLGGSGTYRYHPLLQAFLRRRAESDLEPGFIRSLHQRAAQVFVEAGQIDDAMDQFDIARDVAMSTELLLRVAPSYFAGGRSHTIATWIGRLPPESLAKDGWLLYWDALCKMGHAPARCSEQLEKAYALFERERDAHGLYRSCAAAMQAVVHQGADFHDLDPWIERFESMQTTGPACPEPLLPLVATGMATAFIFHRSDAVASRDWAEKALKLAVESSDIGHRVITGGILAVYFVFYENPARAGIVLDMLRASSRAAESSTLARLTLLEADAMCAWVGGDNGACLQLVREALALAARTGVFVWNDYLNGLGAAAALGSEDVEGAREFLSSMAESAHLRGAFAKGTYHFYAGWDAVLRGDAERAFSALELANQAAHALGYTFAQCINTFAMAQVEWQLGQRQDAYATLALARQWAEKTGCTLVLHGCDLVESDFAWDDDRERAEACLRRGLTLAHERGYHNMFWLRAGTMARVAVRALELGIETAHVHASIVKRRLLPDRVPARVEAWLWRCHLRALGSFEVVRDADRPSGPRAVLAPGGRLRGMPLRLLQAIVAFGARGVRDSQLIDALWPDAGAAAQRRVFDTTLHRLRRALGDDDMVCRSDGRVSLDANLWWIDLWALDDVIAEIERELKRRRRHVLEELCHQLLRVYRGTFLTDDPDAGGWIRPARDRIATKFRRAAESLGKALEEVESFEVAAALYRRALENEQWRDVFHPALTRCSNRIPA